jgi:hypothetical protein
LDSGTKLTRAVGTSRLVSFFGGVQGNVLPSTSSAIGRSDQTAKQRYARDSRVGLARKVEGCGVSLIDMSDEELARTAESVMSVQMTPGPVVLEYSRRSAERSAKAMVESAKAMVESAKATEGWARWTAIATLVIAGATIANVLVAVFCR